MTLGSLAHLLLHFRRASEAEGALIEAESCAGRRSRRLRMRLLETRSALMKFKGDHIAAKQACERLLAEARQIGDVMLIGARTIELAESLHASGETRRAIAVIVTMLADERHSRDATRRRFAHMNLSAYYAAIDERGAARRSARALVDDVREREIDSPLLAMALEPLAYALAREGDARRAATVAGYADAMLGAAGFERGYTETTSQIRLRAALAELLPPAELTQLLAAGAALTPQAAVAVALANDA